MATFTRQTLTRLRRELQDDQADPLFLLLTEETIQFNPAAFCELDHWLQAHSVFDDAPYPFFQVTPCSNRRCGCF